MSENKYIYLVCERDWVKGSDWSMVFAACTNLSTANIIMWGEVNRIVDK